KGAIAPGDVYAINAPYNGGTHLPDITVCTPVFSSPSPHSPSKTGVNALMAGEGIGGLRPPFLTSRTPTRSVGYCGGSELGAPHVQNLTTPTPDPSPQGGGEKTLKLSTVVTTLATLGKAELPAQ